MYLQRQVYRDAVSMTFNQTYEVELPKSGELIGISLYASSTQNASALIDVARWRLFEYLTKIELVGDGSEVIKSLTARQALASAYYDTGRIPTSQWRSYSSVPHRQSIPILFGRGHKDISHRLDLSRFATTTLKITNDATATQLTTDIKITIILHWLREAQGVPNRGYYREEAWHVWTPVAAAIEYNELPVGLPIRRILLEARPGKDGNFKNVSSMGRLMNPIEFNMRSNQLKIYQGSLENLARHVHDELGFEPVVQCENYNTGGNAFDVGIGYVTGAVGVPGTYAAVAAYVDTYLQDDVNDSSQFCNDRVADAPINGVFKGLSFLHHTPLFWSHNEDDSDVLDPNKDRVVNLDITCQSGTTVTGSPSSGIILSRLVV